MCGQQQNVARDVQNQTSVDQSKDQHLPVVRWLRQGINTRHKTLAHTGDDQGGKTEQLDVAQRPVNERNPHDEGLFRMGSSLREEEQSFQDRT